MKNLKFLFTTLLLLCSIVVSAHDFEVDGIYYKITDATNKIVIVTYKGDNYYSYSDEYTGSVVIPESVYYKGTTYSVTSIGGCAFYECSGLTSIEIPNSVTSIGYNAFYKCSRLTSIEIPNSVTSIGNYAFENCSGLTSIEIPNSVTSIGEGAFRGCSGLTAVHVSDLSAWCNIYISDQASNPLYYARNLYLNDELITELDIPDGVTEIKKYAFSGCSGLTSITIPNSVTSIGEDAFKGCSGLTSIIIPNSVTSIGNRAFDGCNAIEKLELNCETIRNWFYGKSSIKEVVIGNNVTSIGYEAFDGCSGLTNVTIGNSVTSIGWSAFEGCSGLTSITIPNSVTSIGEDAFKGCSSLTSVTIGNSVTSIGNNAFDGCNAIEKLELNCETIRNWFYGKSSIKEVVIGNNVTSIGNNAFYGCSGLTAVHVSDLSAWCNIDFGFDLSNPLYYAKNLYLNDELITELDIPDGVTKIKKYAFSGCSGLTSITIPNSVTSIGNGAFEGCSGLTSVTIPNSVTSIGNYTFYGCSGLTSVTIPNSVTSIGKEAFYGCSGLTSITIPNSVTSIESDVFYNCTNLKIAIWLSATPPSGYTNVPASLHYVLNDKYTNLSNKEVLTNLSALFEIDNIVYVPLNVKERTCAIICCTANSNSAVVINDVVSYKNISFTVKEIKQYAFYACPWLTGITLPNSITEVKEQTFYNCPNLTSVTIPNSVTSIGSSAFSGCSGLTSVTIPNGITEIKEQAFYNCPNLETVTIPNSVIRIGKEAFCHCSNLKSATILSTSLTSIEQGVFSRTGLTSITIPEGVTSIGKCAFDNCPNLTTVVLPSTLKQIAEFAFDQSNAITSIKSYAIAPPACAENVLYGIDKWNCTLIVPESGADAYSKANQWSEFLLLETFELNSLHTVTYIVNGETYKTESVAYGAEIPAVEEPAAKEGYTFCWSEIPQTMPAEDITIIGTYVANTYTVTYIVDGEFYKTESIVYGDEIPVPIKEGYTFIGLSEIPATMPAQNITITGEFAVNSYTLTHMLNGQIQKTEKLECGNNITVLEAPTTKEGYTFTGWKLLGAEKVEKEFTINIKDNADEMLYTNAPCTTTAWGDQFTSWAVLFDDNTNTIFHSEYGNKQTPDGLDHYIRVDMGAGKNVGKFKFTYTTRNLENNNNVSPKTIVVEGSNNADGEYTTIATLENLPSAKSTVYTSDVLGNNNTTYRYIRYRVTETHGNSKDNNHPYFAIAEFGMSRVDLVDAPLPTTMPAEDITIEGHIILNSITGLNNNTLFHIVQPYHSNGKTAWAVGEGGNALKSNRDIGATVDINDARQWFKLISNDNGTTHYLYHVEEGKYVNKDGSLSDTPTDKIYLKNGKFENTFMAYFDDSHNVNVGGSNQMVINGWSTLDGGNSCFLIPVSELYTVTFLVDGVEYKVETVVYGAEIPAVEEPTAKEGYTFSGWSEIPATMPAKDITITGTFTVNKYIVTYIVDGKEYKKETVAYGAEIPAIETPTKEGYTFNGWSEIPATMPAEDITITGSFAKNDTAIDDVKCENGEAKTVYDLNGLRIIDVENLEKGIYIVNGKKVLVK